LHGRLRPRVVTCTLAALLFAPVATFGLELGEASIRSGLGQALLVDIPYRLAANERLTAACVTLVPPARAADGLPTYTHVSRITISSSAIEIFDNALVREPLIGLNIDVNCNTAPHFVRSYQLFVDPPSQRPAVLVAGAEVAVAAPLAASSAAPSEVAAGAAAARSSLVRAANAPIPRQERSNASPRARGQSGGDVIQGQIYRVVRGDTLSGIAARVADRAVTIRATMEAIFAANPAAFAHGNRDLLEEGRLLTIPNLGPPTVSSAATAPAVPQAEVRATEPVPAPVTTPPAAQPSPATAPTAAAPIATRSISAASAPVAEPSAAPIVAPSAASAVPSAARADGALGLPAPNPSTAGRTAAWIAALLALGGIASFAWVAFLRSRRRTNVAPHTVRSRPASPLRPRVELSSGIEVIEDRGADPSLLAQPPRVVAAAGDSAGGAPTLELPLAVGPTDYVDLDIGTPVTMKERVAWFEDRVDAAASDDAAVADETIEENAATVRMPEGGGSIQPTPGARAARSQRALDDEPMTLTIVDLDMLRQDYEAEHTLTQALSEELRSAVADLEATKAARAAARETADAEGRQPSAGTNDDLADPTTARIRVK
jgi:phage tail protein X